MNDIELARARITAIIEEIQGLQGALGGKVNDTADREAFDTVSRIERKAMAASGSPSQKKMGAS